MPQRLTDVALSQLVPETLAWNNGQGIDLDAWIACVGSFDHAIAYGELFWPDILQHDGCLFFAKGFRKENYLGFLAQAAGNKQAVEAVMNHRHILDLFSLSNSGESEPTQDQVVYLGRLLKEIWHAKIKNEFPNHQVIVSFPEKDTEGLLDYEITFYQAPRERTVAS